MGSKIQKAFRTSKKFTDSMIWIGIAIGLIIGIATMLFLSYAIGNATEKGRQQKLEDEIYLNYHLEAKTNE